MLQNPKFWTLLVDLIISLALYFIGKYGSPEMFDDIKVVIAALQPLVLFIIAQQFGSEVKALLREF